MKKLFKRMTIFIFVIITITITITIIVIANIDKIKNIIIDITYPKRYSQQVERYSKEYNVDENLVYAIIKAESNFNENAVSNKNAKGLMQIMDETAGDIAKMLNIEINNEKILEPDTNINIGTKYISILINKYQNIELALAAYNAGSGNVDTWITNGTIKSDGSDIENIPYKETNYYVRKIMRDYNIYNEM